MNTDGRKTIVVTIPQWGGRDAGKTFVLTEKYAIEAEKWAWRLFIAVKGTSAQVPENLAAYGMVAVAIRGWNSFMAADVDWTKLEPLLDEMMECVQIVRDPANPAATTGPLVSPDDIAEVKTVGFLRSEVLRLHTNFSLLEALSKLGSIFGLTLQSSDNTSTSPP